MDPLRILVADDHEVVRIGVCTMLDSQEGWQVCGTAADGQETVEKARQLNPDIIVLDLGMPRLNGLEAARRILRHDPACRILILTLQNSEQTVRAALEAGVTGFVLKSDVVEDLPAAIKVLQKGGVYFTKVVGLMVLNGYLANIREESVQTLFPQQLTGREREIVQLIAEGSCNKEMAVLLNLSVKTVETHRSNIMRKLGLHTVSELVFYAIQNNLIQVSAPALLLKQEEPTV
jgi:DNA-binding NarL/FixJ family response regulator